MTDRSIFVCLACAATSAPSGFVTSESVMRAAGKHGCARTKAPKTVARRANSVKVSVPRTLPADEWRKVWDSLERARAQAPPCRSPLGSCGHQEPVHFFASRNSAVCGDNCLRCGA